MHNNSENYIFYCDDCDCIVGNEHRCQQWNTVHAIPKKAVKHLLQDTAQPEKVCPVCKGKGFQRHDCLEKQKCDTCNGTGTL